MRLTLYGMMQWDKTLLDNIVLPQGMSTDIMRDLIIERAGDLYPYYQIPEYFKRNSGNWFTRKLHNFEMMYNALMSDYNPIHNYNREEHWERKTEGTRVETPNITHTITPDITRLETPDITVSGNYSDNSSGENSQNIKITTTSSNSHNIKSDTTTSDTSNNTSSHNVSAFNKTGYSPESQDTTNTTASGSNNNTTTDSVNASENSNNAQSASSSTNVQGTNSTHEGGSRTTKETGTTTNSERGTRTHDNSELNSYDSTVMGNIGVTTTQQMIMSELELRVYDLYDVIVNLWIDDMIVTLY